MGRLIYSMITSLDGYVSDRAGNFGWAAPDREVHEFVNEQFAGVGTYLYGRAMYETMSYWETADQEPGQDQFIVDYARQWQRTEKIVYSTTLDHPVTARTTIVRTFDADAIRRLKASATHDLTIDGPILAAQAIRADLVDEYQLFICPAVVGGGHRFFPDDVDLDLELLDERRFGNGVVHLRYAAIGAGS